MPNEILHGRCAAYKKSQRTNSTFVFLPAQIRSKKNKRAIFTEAHEKRIF